MIIVQLKGGLGNQLFQYAAALSLAKHHRVPVKVDIHELVRPDDAIGTLRNYELQNLIDPPEIATVDEIKKIRQQNIVSKYYQKLIPSYQRKIYNEKRFEYDAHFFDAHSRLYLKGYRQSEKYFTGIEDHIRNSFRLKPDLLKEVNSFGWQVRNQNSVSVHIRRGDYNNPNVKKYHGVLSQEYYQQAINKIAEMVHKPSFFVFSDTIDWVKDNLQFSTSVEFVSGEISKNHYHDFHLMSQCRHNIIANSSFSWWAAWLNDNASKVVIAPKQWFNEAGHNTNDLIPEGWVRI